jgi:uncharacterized protein (TIGR02246 family)
MKSKLHHISALALFSGCFLLAATVHAQTESDKAAVNNLPKAFVAAWAKHDGHQLAQIMAPDVDFINVGGDWLQGRANFELYHTRLLSGIFKDSQLAVLDSKVRFLEPKLAVLHWSWIIKGDGEEDKVTHAPRMGIFTMLVQKRGGEWLIIEAQNTNQMVGENPELKGITPPIVFPDAAKGAK